MKEKLIAFTRNDKKVRNLKIATIIIAVIWMAAALFFNIEKMNIILRILIATPVLLLLFWSSCVSDLCRINEKIIRENKLPIIFFAYTNIWFYIFMMIFMIVFIAVKKMPTTIIFILGCVISELISTLLKRYFCEKIKM